MPRERILTLRQQNARDAINERLEGEPDVCPYFSPVGNPIMGRMLDGSIPPERDHMSVCTARIAQGTETDWGDLSWDNVGCVKSGMRGGVPRGGVFDKEIYRSCSFFPVAP